MIYQISFKILENFSHCFTHFLSKAFIPVENETCLFELHGAKISKAHK